MRPLSTYIEYLLMTRHYAFVPGLGGFMFQEEEARLMLGGRLMPPLRLLKYNRFMDHDDGMLANVIMRAEGLSYDDANQRIRLSVASVLKQTQQEGRCPLGRLGFVFFDEDCHIAFRAADQVKQDAVYYGMNQLNVRSWREVERERNHSAEPKTEEKTSKKPTLKHHNGIVELPTRWLRWAAVILLVITFGLANLLPWNNTKTDEQNYANLVDTGTLLRPANAVKEVLIETQSCNNDTLSKVSTVAEETAQPQVEQEPAPAPKPVPEVKAHKNGKQYIIVVGSCKSQKEADRLVRRLAKKGYNDLKIYERDNRFRIYIEHFDVKSEALSYLYNLRETSPFNDAWLLAVRPTDPSLSYIIKNKDNDQLPMELSHLKQSAERDQG